MTRARTFRTLLRFVYGRASAAVTAYLRSIGWEPGGKGDDAVGRAKAMAEQRRREIAAAIAERERLVERILHYEKARTVLTAHLAAAPDAATVASLRQSLARLDRHLTGLLDQYDELETSIADLEADLAFIRAATGEEAEAGPGPQSGASSGPEGTAGHAADPELARHLAALGLTAMPASLPELKAAYRARLKQVHPDVGRGGSTEAAARATVAFAELRKRLLPH